LLRQQVERQAPAAHGVFTGLAVSTYHHHCHHGTKKNQSEPRHLTGRDEDELQQYLKSCRMLEKNNTIYEQTNEPVSNRSKQKIKQRFDSLATPTTNGTVLTKEERAAPSTTSNTQGW
jgi:cytochrome c553